jgi:hypothetical protein
MLVSTFVMRRSSNYAHTSTNRALVLRSVKHAYLELACNVHSLTNATPAPSNRVLYVCDDSTGRLVFAPLISNISLPHTHPAFAPFYPSLFSPAPLYLSRRRAVTPSTNFTA